MHFRSFSLTVTACWLTAIPAWADETEDRIKEIRSQYTAIEAAATKGEEIKFEAENDPLSGTLTRFMKDGKLVKAVLSYAAGDHGGADERFYFQDGKVVFIHVTDSFWRFGGKPQANGEPGTIDEGTEFRIYLHEGKVIRNLTRKATVGSGEDLNKALAKAENKPSDDKERETEILAIASKIAQIKDAAGLLKLLK